MFGLSLTKILFTVLVFAVVWRGSALLARHAADRRRSVAERAERRRQQAAGTAGSEPARTVDLERCPGCGAFVEPGRGCPRCRPQTHR